MDERGFRLDFFIALAALLTSIITTGALIYQTRVIHDQYAAALWPYLSVDATFGWGNASGMEIDVTNDGFGPALIQSAQLSVDGRTAGGWKAFANALKHDRLLKRVRRGEHSVSSVGSVNGSTIVRAGETKSILKVVAPSDVPEQLFLDHRIALDFCYCSLNGNCWTLHATPGASAVDRPVPIGACTSRASIAASTD